MRAIEDRRLVDEGSLLGRAQVRHDQYHAGCLLRIGRVDANDSALADRRAGDDAIERRARVLSLVGIDGAASHLERPVHAIDAGADHGRAPARATSRTAASVRRTSGILYALCRVVFAPASTASATAD